ncbi:MAG: hemerythrin domain-containing protein [Pseudomonadota bacterium]|nr:hemerythrin domain-containing protein [Pseudomonadota bacterium]
MNETTLSPIPEEPIGILLACHSNIRHQCESLKQLADHLMDHDTDEFATELAAQITRYFDSTSSYHHEDEETDLFPLIMNHAKGHDILELELLFNQLALEHRLMQEAWSELRPDLIALSAGHNVSFEPSLAHSFIDSVLQHLELEEADILPYAEKFLSLQELVLLSKRMHARRNKISE